MLQVDEVQEVVGHVLAGSRLVRLDFQGLCPAEELRKPLDLAGLAVLAGLVDSVIAPQDLAEGQEHLRLVGQVVLSLAGLVVLAVARLPGLVAGLVEHVALV
jgi:hypothetical protein